MRSLVEFRETLDRIGGGTVSVDFAREIIDAAEREVGQAHGEFTITQAVEMSGRSRSWFERHVEQFAADGLARKLSSGLWLLKSGAIPGRDGGAPFDPAMDAETIATNVMAGL